MTLIRYREAIVEDVPEMESVRAPDSEAGPADVRMARYLRGEHHPQQALMPRVMYVAADTEAELQYLYVTPCHRRCGVASGMLHVLWRWFLERDASRICVDVEPDNAAARGFYLSHGATYLNSHWLVWPDIRGP
jgi:ribosomal protein S18 acetylase RimI-like enzyme